MVRSDTTKNDSEGWILLNKMSGLRGMIRIIAIFSLLINCGCVNLKQPEVDFSAFSTDLEFSSGNVHLILSMNKSGILRCECDGKDVEMVGMNVRLFTLEKDEYRIPEVGK